MYNQLRNSATLRISRLESLEEKRQKLGRIEEKDAYLKLWIIPRNRDGLYISDMVRLVGAGRHDDEVPTFAIEKFYYPEMLKKFGILK